MKETWQSHTIKKSWNHEMASIKTLSVLDKFNLVITFLNQFAMDTFNSCQQLLKWEKIDQKVHESSGPVVHVFFKCTDQIICIS